MQKMYMCQPPTSLPFLPPCQYRISLPSTTISPGTSFPVTLALHLPPSTHTSHTSPQLAFHSVSVILERRMDFYEASGAESAPELLSGTASSTPEPSPAASRSSFRSTASTATASTVQAPTTPHTPSSSIGSSTLTALGISIGRKRSASASPTTLPAKSLTTTIATAETTLVSGSSGSAGGTQLTIELAVPPRPPPSQWPVGETTRTDLAAVAFYVRVKVGVVFVRPPSPLHTHQPPTSSSSTSSSGAAPTVYEYELPEREVHMTNVTEEERAVALARVAERRSRSRRPSASASDKQTSSGDPGGSAGVPPLPKSTSTIKFELDDSLKGSVSAAMLNSRLKSVKASRDAASATASVPGPPGVNGSGTGSGSAGSSLPATETPSTSIPSITPDMKDCNNYPSTLNGPPSVRSLTPRPQTASGTPPPAHNNHENTASPAHLIRMRRSQSGKAMYRTQSEVVSPHELDSARLHGVFLAPDWKECGRSGGPSGGRSDTEGSKSDSEAKVRARKDRSPTTTAIAIATSTFDEPILDSTLPHVPSKDDTPPPLPQKKPPPPSPTRPIPPPPSAYSVSSGVQQPQPQPPSLPTAVPTPPSSVPKTATIDVWEKVLDRFATRGKRRSDEMRNQPSPSPSLSMSPSPSPSFSSMSLSPPGSASGHGHGHGHVYGHMHGVGVPQAKFNPSARSSPNLLDPMSGTDLARGRDKQRRTRGNSTVSSRSRSRKTGLFSAILSVRA